jgi:hypothetical protein
MWRKQKVSAQPPDLGGISFVGDSPPDACSDRKEHASMKTSSSTPDVLVRNEGTVFLFCPVTIRARKWIEEHVEADALWFGHALVVEHRYAWGLALGMKDAGLRFA